MKDDYRFVRGTTPVELFDKAETLNDLTDVSRLLSEMPPTETWEYARRGLLDSMFEYIWYYVPEDRWNMDTLKELIQMEYDGRLQGFFERIGHINGDAPSLCNRYDVYKIQPGEVREAVLTELVYSLGLQSDLQTRRCSIVIQD